MRGGGCARATTSCDAGYCGYSPDVASGKEGGVIRVKYQVARVAMVKASVEKWKAVAGGAETEQVASGSKWQLRAARMVTLMESSIKWQAWRWSRHQLRS